MSACVRVRVCVCECVCLHVLFGHLTNHLLALSEAQFL